MGTHRWVAPCPFHQETKPSFSVNEAEGFFYCFGCHASGDVIKFYSLYNGVTYKEALAALAKELGITLTPMSSKEIEEEKAKIQRRNALLSLNAYAAKFFANNLQTAQPDSPCTQYLEKRGLSPEIIQSFGLGFSPNSWDALMQALVHDHLGLDAALELGLLGKNTSNTYYDKFRGRLIFPITTFPNQVIGFGGRIIEDIDAPKYINSPESPVYHKGNNLYGLVQASKSIQSQKYVLLTEGYMDVLTLHQFGYTNAVGVLGTSLTNEQIARLATRFTSHIVLLFDGDPPGRKAALRACTMILPQGLRCNIVLLPDPEDIDSLLRLPDGKERFDELLRNAEEGLSFFVHHLLTLAPRDMFAKAHELLGATTNTELLHYIAGQLAKSLGITAEELLSNQKAPKALAPQQISLPQPVIFHAKHPTALSVPEKQVLMFVARYPGKRQLLDTLGAYQMLKSEAARSLWTTLLDPAFDQTKLSESELALWNTWCGCNAPPIYDDQTPTYYKEEEALKQIIRSFQNEEEKAALIEVSRYTTGTGDFNIDLEHLAAVSETIALRDQRLP